MAAVIENSPFRLRVRTARADEERVGVAFQISHPDDRELIRNLLEAAAPEAENAHRREPVAEMVMAS